MLSDRGNVIEVMKRIKKNSVEIFKVDEQKVSNSFFKRAGNFAREGFVLWGSKSVRKKNNNTGIIVEMNKAVAYLTNT